LDNDDLPDVCLSYTPEGVHFLINNGDLTFDTTLFCTTKGSPHICNLNQDPPDDIILFSTNTDELFLFENLGNAEFDSKDTLPLTGPVMLTNIADYNNDGYDDYCFALCWWTGCTDSIYICINDQNWNFHKPRQYYVGGMELFRTETADLNGDNFNDIIMYGYSPRNAFKILWNDGFGSFGYENPVGIDERLNKSMELKISVSPNPFSTYSFITIKSKINSELKILITDLYGRSVKQFNGTMINMDEPLELNWDGKDDEGIELVPGVYFLKVTDNKHHFDAIRIIKY